MFVSVLEEIAFENGWIPREQLAEAEKKYGNSVYGQYLLKAIKGKSHRIGRRRRHGYSCYGTEGAAGQRVQAVD